MEESVINISLDELVEIEGLSIRSRNTCEYNDLKSLNSILNYYWENRDFRRLRNCGQKSNNELINICEKYVNLSFEFNSNKSKFENVITKKFAKNTPEIDADGTLLRLASLTALQKLIINNLFEKQLNELPARSKNAIEELLEYKININGIVKLLTYQQLGLRIRNVGKISLLDINSLIALLKEQIHVISKIENKSDITIELFNAFLIRNFSLRPIILADIAANYDFSNGLPIFKTLNVLIDNDVIFEIKKKIIFKNRFNYFLEFKCSSNHELTRELDLTKERIRQIKSNIFDNLSNSFSFLKVLEIEALNLYGIDFMGNFIEIGNELIFEINKNEGTNFNTLFVNKALSILLSDRFTLVGDEEGILFNKNPRTSHSWSTTYLVLNNYVKIFDFEGLVEAVSFRLGQRIEEDYHFHFQTYLLEFQKEDCICFIENIAQIAEYILLKEFELTIDTDENIVFKRNVRKQVIDYVYEILFERHEPLTVYEICEIIELKYPELTISVSSLRGSCQKDPKLIFFGRSSTYGLKAWEDELNIKGGTIRNIVEEFLKLHDYPKHIIEVTEYVNLYRRTNTKNILSNLRLDDSGIFIFFYQSFIGLAEKKHLPEYLPYANIPQYLGRSLMAEIKDKGRIDFRKTVDYLSAKISIPESNIEMIITHIIKENNLQIENNFISEANDNRRN